jgi:hypothetical protein
MGTILKIILDLNAFASAAGETRNLIKPWISQLACVSPGCIRPFIKTVFLTVFV